jgi:hypothetical protein
MPISKTDAKKGPPGPKAKSLKVFEQVRDGAIYWQTEAKIPAAMADSLGFSQTGEGFWEVERPLSSELPAFAEDIEGYGFKLKRLERREVVATAAIEPTALSEGEVILKGYQTIQQEEKDLKERKDEKKGELQTWMKDNGAPKDPAHDEARLAQIGTHRVHNSWVKGRQTEFDARDHKPVGDWAIENDCADKMVQVIIHKTVSYEEFAKDGVPEGFEGNINIDPDVYEWYAKIGAIPPEIHDAFEARGKGYYAVKVYETKEFGCPSCGHKMGKTQKFCGECGTKVGA